MSDTERAEAIAAFDLEAPKLPDIIEDNAMESGDYPYSKRMKRKAYEKELLALQIELLKLQSSIAARGERVVVVFEGRDTAGKGGTINRFRQHLNPRHAHIVALTKPTEAERGQWYFQRYVAHLPTAGDMALFDRSWYNRAGVEPVMGFCTPEQHQLFLEEAPLFEERLVKDGIHLIKIWLTIGQEMQLHRLHRRRHDPLKHWKISPIDLKAIELWEEYTRVKEQMFRATHQAATPWTVILSNDKRRARLNALKLVLNQLDYEGKDESVAQAPDPKIAGNSDEFLFNRP
ncbi:MAG: polyphosphate kinase 2 [Rhodomicrobium sp.]|nr:MAG: polyphosphate kinase 2 [Rhodomicrobium sp.]